MRKLLILFLVGLLLISGTSSVFAQANVINNNKIPEGQEFLVDIESNLKYIALKEFSEEFHTINELLVEGHELQINLIEKKDKVLDLTLQAFINGNIQALKDARVASKDLKVISDEIAVVREQIKTERDLFNQSIKDNNLDEAQVHINNIINLTDTINKLTEKKLTIFDNIIDILS